MTRLEVAGGIASGKTTIVQLIASESLAVVYENFLKNPFWRDFYREPERFAFETEVTFLLQHYSQLRSAKLRHAYVALDTSFLVDLGYADVNLSGAEHEAFTSVYSVVQQNLEPLNYLVWLRCGEAEQKRRILVRGREEETSITIDYLRNLNQAIARRVREVEGRITVVEVDSEKLDFAHDTEVQRTLAREIRNRIGLSTVGGNG